MKRETQGEHRKRVVGGRGERKDGDKERGNMVEKEKEREKE